MADEETTEEEPSIEEILDSIRQIISDEDEDNGDDIAADDVSDDDIIELTDPVEGPKAAPEPPPPPPEPEPPAPPEPEPEPEEDIFADEEDDFDPEPDPEPFDIGMGSEDDNNNDDDDHILRGVAENAAVDGFEKLVKKTAVEYNGITIEEIVRTELKPLLREWLDDNLPTMIERLVQEELERVSKRVLGDN
mgnify:CR=1 FL=1